MVKPDRLPSLANRRRMIAWMLFGVVVMAVISIKSFNDGWFEPKTPLALNGEPALVFLTLGRGCECQMKVVRSAEAQLASWSVTLDGQISVFRVDFSRRPDLARQFDIARAPALVLLDSNGEVVWKQDVGLSDEAPLDLASANLQIESIIR
ncbi:MAG: hypothetical protein A2029_15980 [Chloroflexi bacterium RBG_19FT_COMBO_47_9]|nr:MAG: hypothetical protein A2029_15980 [Chloroflexi bacterium RBG_19FT_COMBO_47_9]